MQVVSTNIAKPTTIIWNGKKVTTGIYKKPVNQGIYLEKESVKGDEISDRRVHGGEFKACYIFSEVHYIHWKFLYPDLEWDWGMFGENLTISDLDETQIYIGDIYELGEATIQITEPREPCFKFATKFGSTDALKQFIEHGFSGTYARILKEGLVKTGDALKLIERPENSLTTAQLFNLLFAKHKNQQLLSLAVANEALPERKRNKLKSFIK